MTHLMVVGANPPRRRNSAEALPEGRTLETVIRHLRKVSAFLGDDPNGGLVESSIYLLLQLQMQAAKGIHRNPPAVQLAKKILRLDYVHAENGKEYTHDFTEDASRVVATVVDGGRQINLKAIDGRRIVEDYQ